MKTRPKVAFFGSSLLSAYWNGAATYYRGILKALAARGYRITFYEPDAYDRQKHRDIDAPEWAQVVVYPGDDDSAALRALEAASDADWLVKASGIGVYDDLLERAVISHRRAGKLVVFWDVDAAATLERVHAHADAPFRSLIPEYDLVFTYGGGPPVVDAYMTLGARACVPVYNAVDPETHHEVSPDPRFLSDLSLLANRLPDREARVEEFFFRAAEALPDRRFLLGGNGWTARPVPPNVHSTGHVYTRDHNAWNASALAVLNVARDSMARSGFSPATRVFEAAGAAACIITDAWTGIEQFFEPEREILVAESGVEVAEILRKLSAEHARRVGRAARCRALDAHTYAHRARQVEQVLEAWPGNLHPTESARVRA